MTFPLLAFAAETASVGTGGVVDAGAAAATPTKLLLRRWDTEEVDRGFGLSDSR